MKKLFQITAIMAVLTLMSAPAWSFSYEDHVSVAPNGQGDVLIYPVYFAFDGGFQTKLQVINTKMDASAVAKVVIRSAAFSEEVRDFLIFLSPTDMWEGYLVWDAATQKPHIYSEDDSVIVSLEGDGSPVWASPANPQYIDLVTPSCPGDTNLWGYAEVFLAWVFPDPWTGIDRPIVNKDSIFNRYVGTGSILDPQPTSGGSPFDVREDLGDRYTNILAGNQQIQNPLVGWTSALNAVTLKDYLVTEPLNPLAETFFSRSGAGARNNVLEVEAALAKQHIGMPYIDNDEGNTLHFITFPTKLMLECDTPRGTYYGFQKDSPRDDKVVFRLRAMDMMERTPGADIPIYSPIPETPEDVLPWEVNFLMPTAFDEGWYRYTFTEGDTFGLNRSLQDMKYTGAPAIPVSMNFGQSGFSTMYGVWTDGNVYCTGSGETAASGDILMDGYQYVNSFAYTTEAMCISR